MPSSTRFSLQTVILAAVVLVALPAGSEAQMHAHSQDQDPAQTSDSAAVVAVVHAYHEALQTGDTASVVELLADDVHVAESGGVETREQYMTHHLPGDMAFAAAVNRVPTLTQVVVYGDVAWIMSTTRTEGSFREREINSRGAELMVLSRSETGWLIRSIHWSSRQVR